MCARVRKHESATESEREEEEEEEKEAQEQGFKEGEQDERM